MPILHSYYQDVYRCPIVRLDGYSAQHGLSTGILAYLDFGGATGSSKDGLAETMLAFATERGTLQPGMPVVEASSGSFGAALAVSCATTGHPCILVVPSNLPIAQRKRLQDLGAHIIACSSSGRRAMERVAEDTAKRYGGYYTHYFSNDDNPEYHRRVTGPQIYKNAGDAIDAIVIGVGSGGTITGVAEYIKAWNSMASCTIGRRSGGITGITVMIIHSGRLPDSRKDSTTSRRLMILARFWPVASTSSAFSSSESFSRSIA